MMLASQPFSPTQGDGATAWSVVVSNPLARPLPFLALEIFVFSCFALTAKHAIETYKRGERHHAFQWVVIFFYGLFMELIAFNFLHNYHHGQFTIQLYRDELPLYIPCVYLVLHYAGLKSVERFGLGALSEAILAGFAICLLDIPFDIMGVDAGYWSWTTTDPNLAYRFLGVPVTSFYWYMLFGALLSALCRGAARLLARRSFAVHVAAAPLVAVALLVTGVLAFLPFHAMKALGVTDGPLVAVHMAGCVLLAAYVLIARRASVLTRAMPRDVIVIVVALHTFHLALFVVLWRADAVGHASAKLAAILAAAAMSLMLATGVPLRVAALRRRAMAAST